ncbi:hypothetical protein [Benzoatithermus flavus]|uniref:SH3 domain-containing protein n=1 Tax=Benzoatithermus flavus TaxID=3108223 RepID=A0ABU8XVF4_9PROT
MRELVVLALGSMAGAATAVLLLGALDASTSHAEPEPVQPAPGICAPQPLDEALRPRLADLEQAIAAITPALSELRTQIAALAAARSESRTEPLLALDDGLDPVAEGEAAPAEMRAAVALPSARASLATKLAIPADDAPAGIPARQARATDRMADAVLLWPRRAFVALQDVRYRQGPGLDTPIGGILRAGDVLIVDRRVHDWHCFVTPAERRGCVQRQWLRPARPSD